jgi:tellurite methyltransferase
LTNQTRDKWNKHYHSCSDVYPDAAEVLLQNQHLLPEQGEALDLACGRGANAICLAENGLTTSAWDISSAAIEQLSNYAKGKNLNIKTEIRDVSAQPPETDSFDIIVVSRFLDRNLMPYLKTAIRNNGLIFYQSFIKDKVNYAGPKNPDYLLDRNELLNFFNDWKLLIYREEGITGDTDKGFRNQAMLIAQKTI